jgi:hypothetical protein
MIATVWMGGSLFACNAQCGQGGGDMFANRIFKALSYLDLKEDDVADIKMSARIYRQEIGKIHMEKQFPLEAFGSEELDEKKFLAHCESNQKKMALAKYDFLDSVYASLTKEQKAQFLKEMKSLDRMKQYGQGFGKGVGACGGKPGAGMGPNACDGKGVKR